MSLISYAQNHEDIVLWRALRHCTPGFYIDIGAAEPTAESVTRLFYDAGWRGINVEPLPAYHHALVRERPRDVNLPVVVAAAAGHCQLQSFADTGLSTLDPAHAARLTEQRGLQATSLQVEAITLAELCARHVPADTPIHFLKIDVEGGEAAVLAGADLVRWRPWVIVVEAIDPLSHQPSHQGWEPLLLAHDYRCVLFDGLNRFYLAAEHAELAGQLSVPAHYLDDFTTWHAVGLQHEIDRHRAAIDYWENQTRTAEQALAQLQQNQTVPPVLATASTQHPPPATPSLAQLRTDASLHHAAAAHDRLLRELLVGQQNSQQASERALHTERQRLAALHASLSWRLTAPLRWLHDRLQRRTPPAPQSSPPANPPLRWRLSGHLEGHYSLAIVNRGLALALDQAHPGQLSLKPWHGAPLPPDAPLTDLPPAHAPRLRAMVTNSVRANPVGTNPVGTNPVGTNPVGTNPVGTNPVGANLFANNTANNTDAPSRINSLPQTPPPLPQTSPSHPPLISIVHHYPLIDDPLPADLRLAVFFWEETRVPAATVARLEASFDGLLVASAFVRDALRNSGCRLPIAIFPLGLDHHLDLQRQPVQPPPVLAAGARFRLLHLSSAFPRKGIDLLLAAYFRAFSAHDRIELYLKTFPNPHNTVAAQLDELRAAHDKPPAVILDERVVDDRELLDCYRNAHLLVLPSRGEGFNLPAAEAMALGLPVLVTGYGGQRDFCHEANAALLPWQLVPAASHLSSDDALWAEVDVDALATALRSHYEAVAEHNSSYPLIAARAARAAGELRSHYRWDAAVPVLDAFVASLLASRPTPGTSPSPRRLAILSTWQTTCGIAEYTRGQLSDLLASSSNPTSTPSSTHPVQLRIHCDQRTTPDPGQLLYHPGWELGNDHSVFATLQRIESENPELIWVHHQPSLFSLRHTIPRQLLHLQQQGRVVVLELHSTRPLLAQHRPDAVALEALHQLDRIIVHNRSDLANLQALGLWRNVCLVPLGAVQPPPALTTPAGHAANALACRQRLGIPADALVLASFGFLLPHKGVDSLIRSLAPLQQQLGRPVHLLAVNAGLDERSNAYRAELQTLAASCGVRERVHWRSDYLPIDDCIAELAAADCVVLPYRHTQESASAAVTTAVAALRPVLVSPQPIFADLAACTWRMDGDDAAAITAAVTAMLADPARADALVHAQQAWLTARSWQQLAPQMSALAHGLLADRSHPGSTPPLGAALPALRRPPAARRPRLYVDVSAIEQVDRHTGIQRVVRSLVHAMLARAPAAFDVCPVFAAPGAGYRHSARIPAAIELAPHATLEVAAGDCFLGLDLTAHLFPIHEGQLAWWRARGVAIHYVVYDLIPLLYPQWVLPAVSAAFQPWIAGLARQADALHCISAAVADDTRRWLAAHPELTAARPAAAAPLVIDHFPLGADLAGSQPSSGLPADHALRRQQLAAAPYVLMVGTVEPRKGYQQALDAFELRWAAGDPCALVIVGRGGWHTEDLQQRLRSHPERDRRLFWFEDASDQWLSELYHGARLLLAASWAEGYGLPLIEAAAHGRAVLARDLAVFREVAPPGTVFFHADEAAGLAAALAAWQGPATAPATAAAQPPDWAHSAEYLLAQLGAL